MILIFSNTKLLQMLLGDMKDNTLALYFDFQDLKQGNILPQIEEI